MLFHLVYSLPQCGGPPGGIDAKTTYYVFAAILLMTAYTAVNLPFAALSTELTENIAIRTRLNAARFTGSIISWNHLD